MKNVVVSRTNSGGSQRPSFRPQIASGLRMLFVLAGLTTGGAQSQTAEITLMCRGSAETTRYSGVTYEDKISHASFELSYKIDFTKSTVNGEAAQISDQWIRWGTRSEDRPSNEYSIIDPALKQYYAAYWTRGSWK